MRGKLRAQRVSDTAKNCIFVESKQNTFYLKIRSINLLLSVICIVIDILHSYT